MQCYYDFYTSLHNIQLKTDIINNIGFKLLS